ncbi:general secretion pathway protein D [Methylohalomonas lacus]|uniref:General secretion pathway protein D n=1 Tax=Methylohalomonas lacus TaxID=398773 RepID=A0AAE3HLA4_9GAMM|nr:hypothetical protein [Methylohalomonas lacus]MCS3904416.1 general secretion pathway protein D [Methylohalomonas lacus]
MINPTSCRFLVLLAASALLSAGCAEIEPKPYSRSEGHIEASDPDAAPKAEIPEVTTQSPVLPEPTPAAALEKYTVVVNEVPVKELLFALARDADLNVDLYPGIDGLVTLNAVDQTLPQILDRISRQVDIRYEFEDNNIIVSPDTPFFKSYTVDYVNMSRNTTAGNQLATQINTTGGDTVGGGGGSGGGSRGGGNNSTTDVQSTSNNLFWQRLVSNVAAIIDDPIGQQRGSDGDIPSSANIVATPEAGTINVRATSKQHEYIEEHVSNVVESAQRQVLIQATIVEVELNDQYEAGVNWQALDIAESSLSIASNTIFNPIRAGAANIGNSVTGGDSTSSVLALEYDGNDFSSLINLLEEFGNTNVLSSPQLMVLNNQTAVLKAVENFVYFEIEADTTSTQTNAITTVDSEVRTVPIGVVMAVTPQISNSGVVTLNVRPTVSDQARDAVADPAIGLIRAQISQSNGGAASDIQIPDNLVPVIRVREMESMLRLNSGQTAVLGGLMQNRDVESENAIPGLSKIPLFGRAFQSKRRSLRKSELVIFLRPVIVNNPNLDQDLENYRQFLDQGFDKGSAERD